MSRRKAFLLGAVTLAGVLVALFLLIPGVGSLAREALSSRNADTRGLSAPILQTSASPAANTIVVLGSGTATSVPDMASLQIGVESRAFAAQDAMAETNRKQNAVIDALKAKGVEAKDIQTASLNVFAEHRPSGDGVLAYRATNTVRVTVRKIDQTGALVDAAVAAGANQIYGISFGLSNPEAVMDEARSKAVGNAKSKAENLAKAAGIRLGKVISIVESSGSVPTRLAAPAAEARAGTPVEPGETQVVAQLQVTFAIE